MAATKPLPSETLTMAERYQNLNTKQVMKYVGAESRQTVWEYVKKGKLPKPRYVSPHRPVWRLGELLDYLEGVLEPYEAQTRGFKGDPEVNSPGVQQPRSRKTESLRERFGLGRSKG